MPMQVLYAGGNQGALPYPVEFVRQNDFSFLKGTSFRMTRGVAEEWGASRISGISRDLVGLIVDGKTQETASITIRPSKMQEFRTVFVSGSEIEELGERFGLDFKKLRVIFRFIHRYNQIVPSWQELFTPQFLGLYQAWLCDPAALGQKRATFSWETEGRGLISFPHVPQVCSAKEVGTHRVKGTAELGADQGAPLFTFRWGQGRRMRELRYVRRDGRFIPAAIDSESGKKEEYTPRFDRDAFARYFWVSSPPPKQRGFLQATQDGEQGLLNLATFEEKDIIAMGSTAKPITPGAWYWISAENYPAWIRVSIFQARPTRGRERPYGTATFDKPERGNPRILQVRIR